MLGAARWSIPALVLFAACAFDSGGVYDNGGAASIGSPDTSDSGIDTDASTTAGSGNTGGASTTAADPTTNADASASTTASMTMTSDDDSTGSMVTATGDTESTGSIDSTPLETGSATESTGATTDDTGLVPPPPYYGNCTEQVDCGADGICFMTAVMNAPDAHVCLVPCGDGCPDPDDAIATPLCTMQNYCMLSCDVHEDCPMEMYCYTFANDIRRCLWSQG